MTRHAKLALVLLALALTGCGGRTAAPASADPARLTLAEVEAWRAARTWSSREELLQLYAHLRATGRTADLLLDGEALESLRGISTLFPIEKCGEIRCRGGELALRFDGEQRIPVPGAMWQAAIAAGPTVVFDVDEVETGVLRFRLVDGTWGVRFSWLLGTVGPPFVRDFPIRLMDYRLDDAARTASLVVSTGQWRNGDQVLARRVGGDVHVDLVEPEHPRTTDLIVHADRLEFACFGSSVRVAGDDLVAWGKAEPTADRAQHDLWAGVIASVRTDPAWLGRAGCALVERHTYDLERRSVQRSSFTFQVGEVPPAPPAAAGAGTTP